MEEKQYYTDKTNHGNYQYVTLETLVNDYLMSRSKDDYTAGTPRYQVVYQAMRGLSELFYDILQEVKGIKQDLSPSLQLILPPDFVNYTRISWVDDQGKIHIMAVDNTSDVSKTYLQGSGYELLFDESGNVLTDDGIPKSESNVNSGDINPYGQSFCSSNFQPNRDLSKIYPNGSYKVNKDGGYIQFSSNVGGKEILLEYISDGLYSGTSGKNENEIRINKMAEQALLDRIYHQLVKNMRSVPANEKLRARKEYYNSRRVTKARINTMRKDELLQYFKGSSKWVK